ncbi:MAG: hypothetical protein LC640_09125 [Frankia sp.]|nr:hypothetical protein [Frankia sp.]
MAQYKSRGVGGLSLVGTVLTVGAPATSFAIPNSASMVDVALQVAGDPNTGIGPIAGADKLSVVCAGVQQVQFQATQSVFLTTALFNSGVAMSDGVNIAAGTGTGSSFGATTAQKVGMHGAHVAQETVSGSRSGGAALADLLTKLANKGIIADGSSA